MTVAASAECPCVCHGHGATFRPACDVIGGCGHLHQTADQQPTERSSTAATVTSVVSDLEFVRRQWPALCESRVPGTSRPWRQSLLDPERRAKMAERDREERANRDPDAPGFTSAPQHLDVLDVMVQIWIAVDELAWRIIQLPRSLGWTWATNDAPTDTPQRQLRHLDELEGTVDFIIEYLPVAAEHRADIADDAAQQLRQYVKEVGRLLSLVRGGQLLTGAVCPWCRGVTPKQPGGGAQTMRVEEIAPNKTATDLRPAVEAVHAVVCWNPLCEPPDSDCGTWHRGRPAWPWTDWEWLAKRLIVAEPHRASLVDFDPFGWVQFDGERVPVLPVEHNHRAGIRMDVTMPASSNGVLVGVRLSDYCTQCEHRLPDHAAGCRKAT